MYSPSMERLLRVAIGLLPTLVAGCSARVPAPEPTVPARAARVGALGRVEPAGGVVGVGAIPGEQVLAILKAVGDRVVAGEPVARLSGDELRQMDYEAACIRRDESARQVEAQKEVARATLREAELGVERANASGLEVIAQQARVDATRMAAELARRELDRLAGLEARLVPEQALERKKLAVRQADLELEMQRIALKQLEDNAALGRRAATARMDAAKAQAALAELTGTLAALDKAVDVARRRRDLFVVRAPVGGRVVAVDMHEGEIVGPRPILRVADLARLQVVAEVYETDVRRIAVGQRAEARSDAIEAVLTGRVVEIGSLVAPGVVQEIGMPTTGERRIVEVRIDLDEPARAENLIHLQVDVDFLPAQTEPEPAGAAVR